MSRNRVAYPLVADASATYCGLIREVISETARPGRVVITAHAAGIQLAGMGGDAWQRIDHTDRERQSYLRRFHDIRQELPTHYDLVVNTDVLAPAVAAQVIVYTANAMACEVPARKVNFTCAAAAAPTQPSE